MISTDHPRGGGAGRRRALAALVACAALLQPAFSHADADHERASLAGLTGVRVLVEDVEDDLEAAGASEAALQKELEARLKTAGIRTLSESEWAAAAGRPILKLEVTTKNAGKGMTLFVVELDVEQDVRLARDTARIAPATTWSATARLGVLGAASATLVLQAVRESVDEFVSAWRKANPKR